MIKGLIRNKKIKRERGSVDLSSSYDELSILREENQTSSVLKRKRSSTLESTDHQLYINSLKDMQDEIDKLKSELENSNFQNKALKLQIEELNSKSKISNDNEITEKNNKKKKGQALKSKYSSEDLSLRKNKKNSRAKSNQNSSKNTEIEKNVKSDEKKVCIESTREKFKLNFSHINHYSTEIALISSFISLVCFSTILIKSMRRKKILID